MSTHRRWLVVLAVLGLGVGIEFAQALMPFGRDGDWRDALADGVGVLIGLVAWWVARRFKPK
jgi:VanZ family protein